MLAGLIMLKTRRYKHLIIFAICLRFLGYGLMIRFRGLSNPLYELFIIQILQGIGSGILLIGVLVACQVQVPHAQLAQVTALVICIAFLGSSVGSAIGGGIYTIALKPELARQLGLDREDKMIVGLYDSLTTMVPEWGTREREAISVAYSNVLRLMTYTALGTSVPGFLLGLGVPNLELP